MKRASNEPAKFNQIAKLFVVHPTSNKYVLAKVVLLATFVCPLPSPTGWVEQDQYLIP